MARGARFNAASCQRRNKEKHRKLGLCLICSQPNDGRTQLCNKHRGVNKKQGIQNYKRRKEGKVEITKNLNHRKKTY